MTVLIPRPRLCDTTSARASEPDRCLRSVAQNAPGSTARASLCPQQQASKDGHPPSSSSTPIRTVKSHGHFRWKKHDVYLSEVLWGEWIGLLSDDDETFTVYFAHLPLALFHAPTATLYPLPRRSRAKAAFCASGQACPEAQSKNKNLPDKENVSEMCPV